MYTTAVGSALAMATDVGAQTIQYSGIQDVTSTVAGPNAGKDVVGIHVGPAVFDLSVIAYPLYGAGLARLDATQRAGMLTSRGRVDKLASGAAISKGNFSHSGVLRAVNFYVHSGTSSRGNFSAGKKGIAGIEFLTGTNSNQKIHYGWIRLEYFGASYPTSVEAIDWAYDTTPGQEIAAGATGQVQGNSTTPEPGTAGLSLLALGAAGVLAWRRRRTALSAE